MKPARYDEVEKLMNRIPHTVTYDKELFNPSIAFCLRRPSLCGDIYRMYINNENQDLADRLWMHECGHIIYSHVKNEDIKDKIIIDSIRSKYEENRDRFPNDSTFFDYVRSFCFNIAQDFEVNSKLFDKAEFTEMNELASDLQEQECKGMWPEDYNFPVGLNWRAYLQLMLDNFDKFLDDLENQMSQQGDGQEGDSKGNSGSNGSKESSDGQSNEEGDGTGDGAESDSDSKKNGKSKNKSNLGKSRFGDKEEIGGAGEGKKLSDKTIEKIKEMVDAESNEAGKIEAATECDKRSQYGHCEEEITSQTPMTLAQLEKYLLKNVFTETMVNEKYNVLYNSNRRKYSRDGRGVIIPRMTRSFEKVPDDFYVILDVSGSVSNDFISNVADLFTKCSKKFGKASRLILWDTHLVKDYSLYKDEIKPYGGGGTQMAGALKYVHEKYLTKKPRARVFLISDFEDNLRLWRDVIKEFSLNVYGIRWTNSDVVDDNDFWGCNELSTVKEFLKDYIVVTRN